MTKGFLMFAHNNEEIDYLKLAVVNAYLIKKNCDIHDITVVTNQHSYDYTTEKLGKDFVHDAVSNIVITEFLILFSHKRKIKLVTTTKP